MKGCKIRRGVPWKFIDYSHQLIEQYVISSSLILSSNGKRKTNIAVWKGSILEKGMPIINKCHPDTHRQLEGSVKLSGDFDHIYCPNGQNFEKARERIYIFPTCFNNQVSCHHVELMLEEVQASVNLDREKDFEYDPKTRSIDNSNLFLLPIYTTRFKLLSNCTVTGLAVCCETEIVAK